MASYTTTAGVPPAHATAHCPFTGTAQKVDVPMPMHWQQSFSPGVSVGPGVGVMVGVMVGVKVLHSPVPASQPAFATMLHAPHDRGTPGGGATHVEVMPSH